MNTLKYVIALAVIALAVFAMSSKTAAIAENNVREEPVEIQPSFKERLVQADLPTRQKLILEKVNEYAARHGANAKEMYDTIAKCENKALNPNQQSGHRYDFSSPKRNIVKGEQERSYGLAMIHLPDHPTISHENATDPEFALEWMAKEFADGRESQWTCHTKLFGAY